jgi:hypothetical protein
MRTFEQVRPQHVLLAMQECDELGADSFERRYGFGTARQYVVWHEGAGYDSTAILGVALRKAVGTWVTAADFGDGRAAAPKVLGDLGFEVVPATIGADTQPTAGVDEWSDAAEVGEQASREAWAAAARDVLIETARRYHAVVSYKQLSSIVQTRARIRTTRVTHTWLAVVLAQVAQECHGRGEPLLSALAVNAQGTVGQGYGVVVARVRGDEVGDVDDHAARERLACYQHFGASLPDEGGVAALTPALAAARDRLWAAVRPQRSPTVCPRCNMALPATGVCDNCG